MAGSPSPDDDRRAALQDVFALVGLGPDGSFRSDDVHAQCIRVARRLSVAGRRVVGFVPAGPRVAIPPVGLRIGFALAQLSGATVGYVDANVRLPAFAQVARRAATAAGRDPAGAYATHWVGDSLAVLTPPTVDSAGQVIPALSRAVADGRELFHYMVVDLTGFDRIGEHAEATALVDGMVVVARAGHTHVDALRAYRDELGADRLLGALLVG
ncbi:MAG: hypothetical protein D6689_18490 [Deltaproteobacteria bacterium]|nr:MAG: hypothetical protein D6689_18490 [Deltaproteobacteria bacterium]